jgi:hypothetical protein
VGLIVQTLSKSQLEPKDGSAGEAKEPLDAQVRVDDIIPWDVYTDLR